MRGFFFRIGLFRQSDLPPKAGAKTYVNKRDGWTVLTSDHCMAAHFEHTVAITDDGAEVLTVPADYP